MLYTSIVVSGLKYIINFIRCGKVTFLVYAYMKKMAIKRIGNDAPITNIALNSFFLSSLVDELLSNCKVVVL